MGLLVGLVMSWISYIVSVVLIIKDPILAAKLSALIVSFVFLTGVATGRTPVDTIGWILGFGLLSIVTSAIIGIAFPAIWQILEYTVGVPIDSLIEYFEGVPYIQEAVSFTFVGIPLIASLFIAWRTGPAVDWSLSIRMVMLPLILVVLLIGSLIAIWRLIMGAVTFVLTTLGIDPAMSAGAATGVAISVLAFFVYVEYFNIRTLQQHRNAEPVTADDYPTLHSITAKVAMQLDVPEPTLAITERIEPEAITVGYRPGNATLILSEGIIDILDEAELEAVIAHELAHVANLDTIVMTAALLPRLFADRLANSILDVCKVDRSCRKIIDSGGFIRELLWKARNQGAYHLVWFIILTVPLFIKLLSIPVVNSLSRARESAADRTAATAISSPEAMVSALQTISRQIEDLPDEDLRGMYGFSSLSVLPLDPPLEIQFVREDEEGIGWVISLVVTVPAVLCILAYLETHPPTKRRIKKLQSLRVDSIHD